jgi:hypothetical protein
LRSKRQEACNNRRLAMSGVKPFGVFAIFTALGVLGVTFAVAAKDLGNRPHEGGAVLPCNLAGVNPAFHPEIFGNPAVARSYGFVLGPDRAWHVAADCRR